MVVDSRDVYLGCRDLCERMSGYFQNRRYDHLGCHDLGEETLCHLSKRATFHSSVKSLLESIPASFQTLWSYSRVHCTSVHLLFGGVKTETHSPTYTLNPLPRTQSTETSSHLSAGENARSFRKCIQRCNL